MKQKPKRRVKRHRIPYKWVSVCSVGGLVSGLFLGFELSLPIRFVLPPFIIGIWIVGAFLLWQYGYYHAPLHPTWWESDNAMLPEHRKYKENKSHPIDG